MTSSQDWGPAAGNNLLRLLIIYLIKRIRQRRRGNLSGGLLRGSGAVPRIQPEGSQRRSISGQIPLTCPSPAVLRVVPVTTGACTQEAD